MANIRELARSLGRQKMEQYNESYDSFIDDMDAANDELENQLAADDAELAELLSTPTTGQPTEQQVVASPAEDAATFVPVAKEAGKAVVRNALSAIKGFFGSYDISEKDMAQMHEWGIMQSSEGGPSKTTQFFDDAASATFLKANEEVMRDMGFIDQVVMAAPNMGVAAAISIATRKPQLGSAFMGLEIMGSQIEQLEREGVDLATATHYAARNALMQYPLEKLGLGKTSKLWQGKVAVAKRLKSIFAAAKTEGVTEGLQVLPERWTNILAEDVTEDEISSIWNVLSNPETYKQMGLEGSIGAIFGFGIGAGGQIFSASLADASKESTVDDTTSKPITATPDETTVPTETEEELEVPPVPEEVLDEVTPEADLTIEEAGADPEVLDAPQEGFTEETPVVEGEVLGQDAAMEEAILAQAGAPVEETAAPVEPAIDQRPEVIPGEVPAEPPKGPSGKTLPDTKGEIIETEEEAAAVVEKISKLPALPYHMFGTEKKGQKDVDTLTKAQKLAEKKKGTMYLDDPDVSPQLKAAIRDRLAALDKVAEKQAEKVAEQKKDKAEDVSLTKEQETRFVKKDAKTGKSPYDKIVKKVEGAIKSKYGNASDVIKDEMLSKGILKGTIWFKKGKSLKNWTPAGDLKKIYTEIKGQEFGATRSELEDDPTILPQTVPQSVVTEGGAGTQSMLDEQALKDEIFDKMTAIINKEKAGEQLTPMENLFKLQNVHMLPKTGENRTEFLKRKRVEDKKQSDAMTEQTQREIAAKAREKKQPGVLESSERAKELLGGEVKGSTVLGMKDPSKAAQESSSGSKEKVNVRVSKMRGKEATAEKDGVVSVDKGFKVNWRGQQVGTKKGNPFKTKGTASKELRRLQRAAKAKADAAKVARAKEEAPAKERRRVAEEQKSRRKVTVAPADKPVLTTKTKKVTRKKLPSYTKTKIAQKKSEVSVKEKQAVAKLKRDEENIKREEAKKRKKVRIEVAKLKAKRSKVPMTFARFAGIKKGSSENADKVGADNPERAVAMRSLADKWTRFGNNLAKESKLRRTNDLAGVDEITKLMNKYQVEGQFFREAAEVAEGNFPKSMPREKVRALQKRKAKAKRALLKAKKKKVEGKKPGGILTNEKGQVVIPNMDNTKDFLKRLAKHTSVTTYWSGRGLPKFGEAVRRVFSIRQLHETKAERLADTTEVHIKKVWNKIKDTKFKKRGTKLALKVESIEDLRALVSFVANDNKLMENIPTELAEMIQKPVNDLRIYFDKANKENMAGGLLDMDYLRNEEKRLKEIMIKSREKIVKHGRRPDRLSDIKKAGAQRKVFIKTKRRLQRVMDDLSYLAIPTELLTVSEDKMSSDMKKRAKRLRFAIAKKRSSLTIKDAYDTGILTKADVSPTTLLLAYGRKFGQAKSMVEVRDALLEDGHAKAQIDKPQSTEALEKEILKRTTKLTEGVDNDKQYDKLLSEVKALTSKLNDSDSKIWIKAVQFEKQLNDSVMTYFDKEGKKRSMWITTDVKDMVESLSGPLPSSNIGARLMQRVKMATFFKPWYMPVNDLIQAATLGGAALPNNWFGYGKGLYKAMGDFYTKGKTYEEMSELGGFSQPHANSVSSLKTVAERIQNGTAHDYPVFKFFYDRLSMAAKKGVKGKPVQAYDALMSTLWDSAWAGDQIIRLATYNMLRGRGYSKVEAASNTARAHADYADIPVTTRRRANAAVYTPTYTVSMIKQMINTMLSPAKMMGELMAHGKVSDRTKFEVQGLIATGAALGAVDMLMTSLLGWERDEWGRKYAKEVETDQGPKEKTINVTLPINKIIKYGAMMKEVTDSEFVPGMSRLFSKLTWELTPLLRIGMNAIDGKNSVGEQIFSQFDDASVKAKKGMVSLLSDALPVLKEMGVGKDPKKLRGLSEEESKAIRKDMGNLFKVLNHLGFVHLGIKATTEQTAAWETSSLRKKLRSDFYKAALEEKDVDEDAWIENYIQQLEKAWEDVD